MDAVSVDRVFITIFRVRRPESGVLDFVLVFLQFHGATDG
jgi:hypothetical protein